MAMVIGAFETRGMAEQAVDQLLGGGFAADQVSVMGRHGEIATLTPENETASSVATGAGIGAAIGGFGALLLGAGLLAVPGIGPVLALGPLAAAFSTAMAGGLAGGLIGFFTAQGIPHAEAERYAERVRAGAFLVTVHTDPSCEAQADTILAGAGAEAPIRHHA